jgi:hypothetical protein
MQRVAGARRAESESSIAEARHAENEAMPMGGRCSCANPVEEGADRGGGSQTSVDARRIKAVKTSAMGGGAPQIRSEKRWRFSDDEG